MKKEYVIIGVVACHLLGGCDPLIQVTGTVLDDYGNAISGATIETDCNLRAGKKKLSASSDEKGEFKMSTIGCLPKSCSIQISETGYKPKFYKVQEHCTETILVCGSKDSCSIMNLKVVKLEKIVEQKNAADR